MAHYAKIENNSVAHVIIADEAFIRMLPGEWIQTSYNTRGGVHYDITTGEPSADQTKALHKNYAGIGCTYDRDRDAFIPPQPAADWTLNETSCLWEPSEPVEEPEGEAALDKLQDVDETDSSEYIEPKQCLKCRGL